MTDLQLPDDVRDSVEATLHYWGSPHLALRDVMERIVPILLAEGAKQQREIDAGIAENYWDSFNYPSRRESTKEVAAAIRNQGGQ